MSVIYEIAVIQDQCIAESGMTDRYRQLLRHFQSAELPFRIKIMRDFEMKHTLQDWANLAEIVGTAAIIFSLLFVGLQISDNTREMRSAAATNATESLQNWYVEIATNPQAASVFRKGMNDPNALSKEEAFQYLLNIHSAMLAYQNVYFLGSEGTLDASLFQAMSATMAAVVPTPGFKWYWQQRSNFFTREFREFVSELSSSRPDGGAEIYR
jgi:hypothetical protein